MLIIMAIFLIANAAIGVECYNGNKNWDDNSTRKNSKNFMIVSIVFGILAIFGAIAMIYQEARSSGAKNASNTLRAAAKVVNQ